jgi:replicative DNA helicase
MVTEDDRQALDERIVTWPGPLPFDLAHEPERLAEFAASYGAGTVVIDSLKDVARDLSKDETGSRVNLAFQHTVAAGIELLVNHHQRKEGADGKKPTRLDDVYGSVWITAGTGSVLFLWGQPGDTIVDLHHLKQPAEDIGPLKVRHDHERGMPYLHQGGDLYELVALRAGSGGLAVADAARHLFDVSDPSPNQIEKARRRLDRMVAERRIGKVEGGNGAPTKYLPLGREA